MAINLNVSFNEGGSGSIGFTFIDLSGDSVTPNTFVYTLTEMDGTVINSRSLVSVTPAATTFVVLQGDDLPNPGGIPLKLITISGTYDSLVGGNSFPNLPFNEEYNFNVNELINIVL